jgi:hypothetical protein
MFDWQEMRNGSETTTILEEQEEQDKEEIREIPDCITDFSNEKKKEI